MAEAEVLHGAEAEARHHANSVILLAAGLGPGDPPLYHCPTRNPSELEDPSVEDDFGFLVEQPSVNCIRAVEESMSQFNWSCQSYMTWHAAACC